MLELSVVPCFNKLRSVDRMVTSSGSSFLVKCEEGKEVTPYISRFPLMQRCQKSFFSSFSKSEKVQIICFKSLEKKELF